MGPFLPINHQTLKTDLLTYEEKFYQILNEIILKPLNSLTRTQILIVCIVNPENPENPENHVIFTLMITL